MPSRIQDEAELRAMLARGGARVVGETRPVTEPLRPVAHGPQTDPLARLSQSTSDPYASKTEARYALTVLNVAVASGEVSAWWYEGIKVKLAAKCYLTPDFLLMLADGSLQVHEIKGWWREDARVKIKVAASMFPCFRWRAVTYRKGLWRYEDF